MDYTQFKLNIYQISNIDLNCYKERQMKRRIDTFIEKNKLTSLEIKGGLMGTEVMDVAAVKALAATPSREELLATMVGCLVSPVSALVSVLEEIAEKKEAA